MARKAHRIVRIARYQGRLWFLCSCGEPCHDTTEED